VSSKVLVVPHALTWIAFRSSFDWQSSLRNVPFAILVLQ
jgi:hypothetical protein